MLIVLESVSIDATPHSLSYVYPFLGCLVLTLFPPIPLSHGPAYPLLDFLNSHFFGGHTNLASEAAEALF